MNKQLTEIIFLLDRSGSMAGLEAETIKGYNAFVEQQRQFEGETKVTTVLFDDVYEMLHIRVSADAARLTEADYFTRGCTALLDAIGLSIDQVGKRLQETQEADRPSKVIMVITTDGLENASRHYGYQQIKDMIRHQESVYNWSFIFLGANIDVAKEADKLGILQDNAIAYQATETGTRRMYKMAASFVAEKRRL